MVSEKKPQSYQEQFQERLRIFIFSPETKNSSMDSVLEEISRTLHPMADNPTEIPEASLKESLGIRTAEVQKKLGSVYERGIAALAESNLISTHSYQILFDHTRILDALHRFVFQVACHELPSLIRLRIIQGEKELNFKKTLLPKKKEMLESLKKNEEQKDLSDKKSVDDYAYYNQVHSALSQEIEEAENSIVRLETMLPVMENFTVEIDGIKQQFVLFARGGYGRAELSFSSDIDTGYCVDTSQMGLGEIEVFQELVMRMETLLQRAGVNTSHQYFEIDENLSRFTQPETIHTIPSVLEARKLVGNSELLEDLKGKFLTILPFEDYLKKKITEIKEQKRPTLTEMDLKEDSGGLRSIQIPFWILGVTYQADSFMTGDLINLALKKNILSVWEATKILLALELLSELRNFMGLSERYYYDQEARAGKFNIGEFKENFFNDGISRLYLFKKRRFSTIDELDSYRLRLVADIQKLSAIFLSRILDRTISHDLDGHTVSVHLGNREIIGILPKKDQSEILLRELFKASKTLLGLMCYIARTDYGLDYILKDKMAEIVGTVKLPRTLPGLEAQASQFSELMTEPFAHRAMETMLEIDDPSSDRRETLLGMYIPEFNQLLFMVRDPVQLKIPVHQHLIKSLSNGQKSLLWLKSSYPEFFRILQSKHILALKWSLLLHGLGKIEGGWGDSSRSAEMAVETLKRLGYRDDSLEEMVRLLIVNHRTMIDLSKTATYLDQSLMGIFQAAGLKTVNMILLFLVNLSILEADGESSKGDVAGLHRIFEETSRILAEVRGVTDSNRSLELINIYLDQKKVELQADTRLYLLLNKCFSQGMEESVFFHLQESFPEEWEKLKNIKTEMETQQKQIILGNREMDEQERLKKKLIQTFRNLLSKNTIEHLTKSNNDIISWFFSSFPNRYLLTATPQFLANQLEKFGDFNKSKVVVDVVTGAGGRPEGLLICTRELENSHTKVAYALNRKRINIISGKVNKVEYPLGVIGYSYYFQISHISYESMLFPKDLENMILIETIPEYKPTPLQTIIPSKKIKVEFLEDDGKGYFIAPGNDGFYRCNAPFKPIKIVQKDEPFVFFKVNLAFDLYEVEIQQFVITTTGNQVMDYFYLHPHDIERLRASNFTERLTGFVQMSLV